MKKYQNASPWQIFSIGQMEFEAARKGEKTVQQALSDYQMKGQEMLEQIMQGKFEMPEIGIPVEGKVETEVIVEEESTDESTEESSTEEKVDE